MAAEIDEWEKCVKEAQREYPWAVFLDKNGFSELFKNFAKIHEMLGRGSEPRSQIPHDIYPFLWKCFPDKWEEQAGAAAYYGIRVIRDTVKAIDFNTNNIEEKVRAVTVVINEIREKVFREKCVEDPTYEAIVEASKKYEKPAKECVFLHVLEKGASQNDAYTELVRIYKDRIHPSFVLTCDSETSVTAMKAFLDRLRLLPDKDFSVLYPGRLPREVMDYLVGWVSKRYSERSTVGRLHIVVRKTEGEELFSFVARCPAEEGPLVHPKRSELGNKNIKLEKLTWYETGPLTGKTTHMRKQVEGFVGKSYGYEKRFVSVSVAEDFQPASFIKIVEENFIESEGKFDNVFVHFNVSPYCPLEEFGVFLYNLLAWGIIINKETGEIFYVGSNLKWYIAVEISAAPEGDDTCPFDSIEKVKGAIPLVETFFEPEKVENIELDTESEDFLLCLGGFAVSYPETDEFPGLVVKRMIKQLEIKYLYEFYLKLDTFDRKGKFSIFIDEFRRFLDTFFEEGQPKTTAILARLVKLISDRFRALMDYCNGKYIRVGNFFVEFYNSLYIEMKQFTKNPLEAPTTLMLFRNNEKEKEVFIMDFTDNNALKKKKEQGHQMLPIKSLEEVRRNPVILCDLVNGAFGISNSMEVLDRCDYPLTPDSARALLFMRQCVDFGQSIVLPERPEVQELLSAFSVLMNSENPPSPKQVEGVSESATGTELAPGGKNYSVEGIEAFHKLRMDPSTTPNEFRGSIASIARKADEARVSRSDSPCVVVLIECCTSTSVMGMVKEVIVDRTLGGVKLPKNIVFIGTYNAGAGARPMHPSLNLLEVEL